MSSKLRGIKRGQQKKDPMVLAIVDGGNVFSLESCAFVPKSVAEKEGYIYVEGKTPEQLHRNMLKMAGVKEDEHEEK